MVALGLPCNAPNNQTWAVIRKGHDHAVVGIEWDDNTHSYRVTELTSADRSHAISSALSMIRTALKGT